MGPPTPNPTDRRVQRTRRALREALIALLHVRGWDEISVQDICDRADVGRSTFYLHFADKEELLLSGFDALRTHLRAELAATRGAATRPLGFAPGLLAHAHDNRRLFLALVGKRSGQVVLRRFRDLVLELVAEDLAAALPATPARDAAVHFIAGAFLELLTWSLETRIPVALVDLERLFAAMASAALAAERR